MNLSKRNEDAAAQGSDSRSALLPLVLLIALGTAMRLYRIGSQSFWVDELWTVKAACLGGKLTLDALFRNVQGPAHAAIVHAVGLLSGREAVLRGVSALFGVATIPVVYALARDLFDRRTALLAALLAAISPFLIWYSQELRNYAMAIFFAGLSSLAAWRLVERRGGSWTMLTLATVLGVLSNLSAAFLAIGHWVFAGPRLLADGRFARRWVLSFAIALLLVSPWVWGVAEWTRVDRVGDRVGVLSNVEADDRLRGETTFTPMAIPYSLYAMAYGYSLGPSNGELHREPPLSAFARHWAIAAPAILVLGVALLLGLARFAQSRARLRLLLATTLAPLVVTSVLAILNIKVFNPRYLAVVLPVIIVLVAAGVTRLAGRSRIVLAGLLVGLSLWSVGNYYWRPAYWREDVRSASRHIEKHEQAGDIVLVPVVRDVFDHYYEGELKRFLLYPGQAGSDAEVDARVTPVIAGHSRLWFLSAREWQTDPDGRIPALLDSRYDLLDTVRFPGVVLSLYDLGPGVAL